MKSKTSLLALFLVAMALAGCTGNASVLPQVQQDWLSFTLLAVFGMYMFVGALYMIGTGFGIPGLIAWCKTEWFQITATAIMVFLLVLVLTGIDAGTAAFLRPDVIAKYDPAVTGMVPASSNLMNVAQGYMKCQSEFIWSSYNYLIVITAPLSIIYSSTIHIRPLKMGFSIQPAKFLQPIMDNVGIASSIMATGAWASRLLYYLLQFSDGVMFAIFLPLGVVLRSFPFTRSIGGALMAVAIAFYVAFPAAVIVNLMVYEDHYGALCIPTKTPAGQVANYHLPTERIAALWGGTHHYLVDAMVKGGGLAPSYLGKAGALGWLGFALMYGETLAGGAAWLIFGAVWSALQSFYLAVAREIIFMTVILTFVGGVVQYMITFTCARELGKILGADVDLNSLLKIL